MAVSEATGDGPTGFGSYRVVLRVLRPSSAHALCAGDWAGLHAARAAAFLGACWVCWGLGRPACCACWVLGVQRRSRCPDSAGLARLGGAPSLPVGNASAARRRERVDGAGSASICPLCGQPQCHHTSDHHASHVLLLRGERVRNDKLLVQEGCRSRIRCHRCHIEVVTPPQSCQIPDAMQHQPGSSSHIRLLSSMMQSGYL